MRGIKTLWTCGPGSKLYTRVCLSWIPSGVNPLKLKYGGSLVKYIKQFQGLAILWRKIYTDVEPEYRIVTQMVEQIEYPPFSGPYKSINNWYNLKCTFFDAAATLRAHNIIKMTAQTKRAIKNEVNDKVITSDRKS